MKFQVKALVAALALSAATVPAQAAMTFAPSGDSSMILTLLDFNSNISATFDLGYSYTTFQDLVTGASATGTYTFDLASGDYADAWSTYWGTASATTTKWAIYAADGSGNGLNSRGIISTYKSGGNYVSSNGLQTSIANFNAYMTNNNGAGNHGSVDNGASVVTTNLSVAYAGGAAYGSTGLINGRGHVSMDNLGTTMTVVQNLMGATQASVPSFATLGNADGNYTFNMASTGVLTFSVPVAVTTPVPEADSYAMLLAGLGVVGLVARRRKA